MYRRARSAGASHTPPEKALRRARGKFRKRRRRVRRIVRGSVGKIKKRGRLSRKLVDAHVAAPAAWDRELGLATGNPDSRIVVGPWTNEVGYELLYWIPLLRYAFARRDIDPERIVAVSRGGVASWYAPIAARYVDIFELSDPNEFVRENRRRELDQGGQRQLRVTADEQRLVRQAASRLDLGEFRALYPASMYRFITGYLRGYQPAKAVLNQCDHSRFPAGPSRPAGLPFDGDYLAAKFYVNPTFPRTDENQAFVGRLLERVAQSIPVVVLNTGLDLDDHGEFELPDVTDVHAASPMLQAKDNLGVQSALIANSRGFIGTYGGFSYLAPLLGVRSVGIFTRPQFLPVHLATASVALSTDPDAGFSAVHATACDLFIEVLAKSATRSARLG